MDDEVNAKHDGDIPGDLTAQSAATPATPSESAGSPAEQPAPGSATPKRNRLWMIVGTIVIVLVLLAIGIVPRIFQQSSLNAASAAVTKSNPIVNVIQATQSSPTNAVDLPGTIEAVEQTEISARATGYVSSVLVDIGDKVKAGQTLAVITAPDTDQQTVQGRAELLQSEATEAQAVANLSAMEGALAQQQANLGHSRAAYLQAKAAGYQADAQLAQAQQQYREQEQAVYEQVANANLADVTNRRQQYLYQNGAVAEQTADQAAATYQVNEADLSLNKSALSASAANIKAYQENVSAGQANVAAAVQDIGVARAEVATAISNVHAAQASVTAAQATVAANEASLSRLVVLQDYENVTSPFAGIVTARNIDPGAYISAGGAPSTSSSVGSSGAGTSVAGGAASGSATTGSATSSDTSSSSSASSGGGATTGLFTVANIGRLRIYVNLPQSLADAIQVGQTAQVISAALPLRAFSGTVTQSAIALDPTSRTLVAEVQLDNPGGVLRPGMFGDVKVTVPETERYLKIPDPAVLTGPTGPQVVIVGSDNKIHFQNVTIGQDDGISMQIVSGLTAADRVVAAPNYDLVEGETVQVQAIKPAKHAGAS
jgi:multidrug efflux pump subunit AcrA (membrane-fusion protein)